MKHIAINIEHETISNEEFNEINIDVCDMDDGERSTTFSTW